MGLVGFACGSDELVTDFPPLVRKHGHFRLVRAVLWNPRLKCVSHSFSQPAGAMSEDLLQYWIRHPEAQGTEEVIAEWWLLEHRIHQVMSLVRPALADLVRANYVVAEEQADGRVRYRLNREKESEIGERVAGAEGVPRQRN
jgi:hypothetical protein